MKPLDRESRRLLEDALAADAPPASAEARIWDALSMRLDAPLPPTAAAAKAAFESNGAGFGDASASGSSGGAANGGAGTGIGSGGGGTIAGGSSGGAGAGVQIGLGGVVGSGGAGAKIGAGGIVSGGAGTGLGSGAGLGVGAGVGATSAAVIGAKIVVGVLVGAVGAGSVWWYANSTPQQSAMSAERAVVVAAPPSAASVKPGGITVAADAPVAQTTQQASAPADAQANAPSTPSLAEETQLLADAQRALSAGAPDRALALIEAHRARFPRGSLSPEREAARVVALCALGRVREAGRARSQFLRAWPSSPLASRVSAACPAPGARRAK